MPLLVLAGLPAGFILSRSCGRSRLRGSALEQFADSRARRELAALLDRTPRIAHRLDGDAIADVPAEQVQPGDRFLLGEPIPVTRAGIAGPHDAANIAMPANSDDASAGGRATAPQKTTVR